MANDITFILKARNEARKTIRQTGQDMESIAKEAKRVEAETKEASKATGGLSENMQEAKAQTDQLKNSTQQVRQEATLAARAFGLLSKAVATLGTALAGVASTALPLLFPAALPFRLAKITTAILAIGSGLAGLAVLGSAARSAREFNAALAETSTLIEGTPVQLGRLEEATRRLVQQYGGSTTQQVQAFYQAISAGASNIPDATRIVEQANKLALGGVTDVATGVDILTTAVNAYGSSTITAQEASDALFVAMQQGKTTIGELSSNLGVAIPLATNAGVSFDELAGATAALTTQGISTNVAVTQLRAILQSVIKPTAEAQEAAQALGVEFSLAALETKGLQGFLQDLRDAAGDNTERLSRLFGSVEALAGVLALTGGGAQKFTEILTALESKLGATDEAASKIAENLDQRLNLATSRIGEVFQRLGQVVLSVVVPAMEAIAAVTVAVADNIDLVIAAVSILAIRVLPRLIGLLSRSITGLRVWASAQATAATSTGLLSNALQGNFAALRGYAAGAQGATRATRLLAAAISAVPFLAIAGAVVTFNRAISESREATDRAVEGFRNLKSTLDGLDTALEVFATDFGRKAAEGVQDAAEATLSQLRSLQEDVGRQLQLTRFTAFTPSGARNLRELQRIYDDLGAQIAETAAIADAATARIEAFNLAGGGVGEQLRQQAQAQQQVGEATFATIPAARELRAEYGELAVTVRETISLQNQLAEINSRITFGNLLAEASQFLDTSSLTADKIAEINGTLIDLKTTNSLGDASQKALTLAQNIIQGAGGLEKLDASARQAVEKLAKAALEAANTAARTGDAAANTSSASGAAAGLAQNIGAAAGAAASLVANLGQVPAALNALQADVSNQIAAIQQSNRALEIQLEQGFGAAAAERQERLERLVNETASVGGVDAVARRADEIARLKGEIQELNAVEQRTVQLREQLAAANAPQVETTGGAAGSAPSGGSATSAASEAVSQAQQAREALNESIQSTIQGYQNEIELLGLYGEELALAKDIQNLQNQARAQGIELTQQQIELIKQERQELLLARQAADTFSNGFRAGLAEISESAQTNIGFAKDFTVSAFNGLTQAITDFVTTGKADFRGLLKSLLAQIVQFLAQRLVMNFLNAFGAGLSPGGMGGNGRGGFGGGLLGGLFGRAASVGMADGGLVSGRGGPREDNLLRFLSSGEFVTNARATRDFLPLLQQINSGRGDQAMGRVYARAYAAGAQDMQMQQMATLQASGVARETSGPVNITQNFNFPNADADSFRRSEGQIRARQYRMLQEAGIRNNR